MTKHGKKPFFFCVNLEAVDGGEKEYCIEYTMSILKRKGGGGRKCC